MGLLGKSPSSYQKDAALVMMHSINQAREERDKTATSIEGSYESFADATEAMFSPFMGEMQEGMAMLDRFSDPEKFQEALDMFYANPQYKVLMEQSNKAMERVQARSGDRYSPGQIARLVDYSQEVAGEAFGDFMSSQLQIAGQKIGIGQAGYQGVQKAREAGLTGEITGAEMRDRSADIMAKGEAVAGYLSAKSQEQANKIGSITKMVGQGLGMAAGFMLGGPMGAMVGGQMGGAAGGSTSTSNVASIGGIDNYATASYVAG